MRSQRVVAIGASAGGVDALKSIAAQMPADFPAPILVVMHIGKQPSILPSILGKSGPLGASHAIHGEALRPGHFHVAPPDHHMIVENGRIALSHGPKEHHARPALDPLFRSVGLSFGSRAIAIVLTGWGTDGTAGLQAVKACGGITITQDPEDARHHGMPLSALRAGAASITSPLAQVGALLVRLSSEPPPPPHDCPRDLAHEQDLFLSRGDPVEHLSAIGEPSTYVCPECKGALWSVADAHPPRFRCHTGHAYTLGSLHHHQAAETDSALWSAFRGLQEEVLLLRDMARSSLVEGDTREAARLEMAAEGVMRHARRLRDLLERQPDDVVSDTPQRRTGD